MFARPFALADLNLTRQIRDTLAPTDYQISLLIRVDCSRDGIKLLRRTLSAFGTKRTLRGADPCPLSAFFKGFGNISPPVVSRSPERHARWSKLSAGATEAVSLSNSLSEPADRCRVPAED